MIAYGVCVRSQEAFQRYCLPGIVTHGGEAAVLLTATDVPLSVGYNDILDAAAELDDLEALVLLADDCTIEDTEWQDKVLSGVLEGTDVGGVIGASGGTGLDWWSWDARHGGLRTPRGEIRHDRGSTIVEIVDGSCIILSPKAVQTLRFGAETFGSDHGAEIDLCFQAAEADLYVRVLDLDVTQHGEGVEDRGPAYDIAAAAFQAKWAHRLTDRVVSKLGSASDSEEPDGDASPPDRDALLKKDRAAGTKTELEAPESYYGFERPELIALVPTTARRVLDVGCAAGALGAGIKRLIPDCEVSGIEYVQSVVDQAAARLDHAVQADLNSPLDLPFPHGYFDTMICGDVLEHLLDPAESLNRLLPYLSADGRLIASIPNVKHWSILIPALGQDRWEYTDAGLLDRTHVHLFTLTEIYQMLHQVGLTEIAHLGANNIPIEPASKLDPLVTAAVAYGADANEAKTLLTAYQYLIVAKRG